MRFMGLPFAQNMHGGPDFRHILRKFTGLKEGVGDLMILWEKSDCSRDWTELLSILADQAKLTEKCSKNCGLLPKTLGFLRAI